MFHALQQTLGSGVAGAISAGASLVLAATADLRGQGKLDAPPALVVAVPSADLKATGKLFVKAGDLKLIFAVPSADLRGQGKLDATPVLSLAATADLKADGKLDGTPDIVFAAASADLSSTSALDATPDIVLAVPSADLLDSNLGAIAATPDIVFSVPSADLKAQAVVTVSGETISHSVDNGNTATTRVQVRQDGTIEKREGSTDTQVDASTDWIIPNNANDDLYEVMFTRVVPFSDAPTGGDALDVWHRIDQTIRFVEYANSVDDTDLGGTITVHIRYNGGAELDTGGYNMSSIVGTPI